MEIGDPRKLGRIGLRTLGLTALFSLSAVLIGVTMTNIIKPGVGLDQAEQEKLQAQFADKAAEAVRNAETAAQKTIETRLIDMLPNNLMAEVVGAADGSSPGNGMLAVMVFSLIFGIAVASAGQKAETLVRCLEGVFAAAMHVIGFAMKIAPLAVACLLFSVTVTLGAGFLVMLGKFVATVLAGLAIHAFVVYPAALLIFARRSPLAFFRDSQEAALTAFATSSSNATLPVSLRVAEEELKINPKVAKFVLTVGATGNQNGTALFEGVVVLFLAQVFGKNLGLDRAVYGGVDGRDGGNRDGRRARRFDAAHRRHPADHRRQRPVDRTRSGRRSAPRHGADGGQRRRRSGHRHVRRRHRGRRRD